MKIPQRLLITQSQLRNYSGSEVVVLELAEHFSGLGTRVTVLTNFFSYPIRADFEGLSNVEVVQATSEAAEKIDVHTFDLVWIHHLTLTKQLLEQLGRSKTRPAVIFHHMSKSEPLEFPIMYEAEQVLGDLILFNSQETLDNLRSRGVNFDDDKVLVLGNPAPNSFFRDRRGMGLSAGGQAKLRKAAVVSNHPPDEIRQAVEMLRKHDVRVDYIGRTTGGTVRRITPDILSSYDAVVTIGKTVQCCILGSIPIYCYDRFGGPGFLNEANFKRSRQNNFSGRGFGQKTAEQITAEIISQFQDAAEAIEDLHDRYSKNFLLSKRLEVVLDKTSIKESKILAPIQESAFVAYCEVVGGLLSVNISNKQRLEVLEGELRQSRANNKVADDQIAQLRQELRNVTRGKLHRLGRSIKGSLRKRANRD